jgi:predicted Zn-ribbon and HTH transcriptional regulator
MSVAEMKLAAINEISKLNNEATVKEILDHLAKISKAENTKFDTEAFFEKASKKYDDILQKLAQ